MDELITKYPEFEEQIKDIFRFQRSLKTFRTISIPSKPTGIKQKDIPVHFSHFLNILHLRFHSQIDYLVLGLQNPNPEAFSTARNCLESIAALIFVYAKVKKRIDAGEYVEADKILYKASMGSRTDHPKFATSEQITDMAKKAYNVLDYIDEANDLVAKDLKKTDEEVKQNYFRSQYDLLCELTHPNYLALSMFWGVNNDKFKYNLPPNTLTEENFGLLLHTILPFLPVYMLYLKRSQEFEKKMYPEKGEE